MIDYPWKPECTTWINMIASFASILSKIWLIDILSVQMPATKKLSTELLSNNVNELSKAKLGGIYVNI